MTILKKKAETERWRILQLSHLYNSRQKLTTLYIFFYFKDVAC